MSTEPFLLPEGTRVIVTAGASGIGRAIADLLIAQKARVHICDIDDAALAAFKKVHPAHGATKADVSKEADVDTLFADAAKTSLAGILGYEVKPLVSADYARDTRSAIVDALSTMVTDKTLLKIYAWYDNEMGYACRMVDLACHMQSVGI